MARAWAGARDAPGHSTPYRAPANVRETERPAYSDLGSSKPVRVEVAGIEPASNVVL